MKTQIRCTVLLLISVIIILSTPQRGQAYDNDTHFWLTYYLAIKTGYSPVQAAQIASANISVDFDKQTDPVLARPNFMLDVFRPIIYTENPRIYLHAFPLRRTCFNAGETSESEIYKNPLDPRKSTDPAILSYLAKKVADGQDYRLQELLKYPHNPGVFLHYLQDKYSHKGFWSGVGHAGYEYVDYLATSPADAKLMIIDTVNYLIEFKKLMAGQPIGTADSIAQNWRQLDAKDRAEIDLTLNELIRVNPSPGIQETGLLNQWVLAGAQLKLSLVNRILERWKNRKMPDSFKAREVIAAKPELKEKELPFIWYYNLHQGGFPDLKTQIKGTSKIRVYRVPNINENFKEEDRRNSQNKRLCLPWKLVAREVVEVPLCK